MVHRTSFKLHPATIDGCWDMLIAKYCTMTSKLCDMVFDLIATCCCTYKLLCKKQLFAFREAKSWESGCWLACSLPTRVNYLLTLLVFLVPSLLLARGLHCWALLVPEGPLTPASHIMIRSWVTLKKEALKEVQSRSLRFAL